MKYFVYYLHSAKDYASQWNYLIIPLFGLLCIV
jgi:hypothetical protein